MKGVSEMKLMRHAKERIRVVHQNGQSDYIRRVIYYDRGTDDAYVRYQGRKHYVVGALQRQCVIYLSNEPSCPLKWHGYIHVFAH